MRFFCRNNYFFFNQITNTNTTTSITIITTSLLLAHSSLLFSFTCFQSITLDSNRIIDYYNKIHNRKRILRLFFLNLMMIQILRLLIPPLIQTRDNGIGAANS